MKKLGSLFKNGVNNWGQIMQKAHDTIHMVSMIQFFRNISDDGDYNDNINDSDDDGDEFLVCRTSILSSLSSLAKITRNLINNGMSLCLTEGNKLPVCMTIVIYR